MPWKETSPVNERMRFVARLEEGERMTDLCREFGISRKTGYKLRDRYREFGPRGLYDQPRAPIRRPAKTPPEVEDLVIRAREAHPTWGAKKLHALLRREQPGVKVPAVSTIHDILKRKGLVKPRRRRKRAKPQGTPLVSATAPNALWCADFKGQFRLKTGSYCYPLTITDAFSRYVLAVVALENTKWEPSQIVFEEAFREFGVPAAIRTDNGAPFASCGLAGLSRLSAWWTQLGIRLERIEPGHPEQNGRHERMHLTLKREATRPGGRNMLHQQELFDDFRQIFNHKRPHEALGQATPGSLYLRSERTFPEPVPALSYPLHDLTIEVSSRGWISFRGERYFYLGAALSGQRVGLREVGDGRWLISFADMDLGHYDELERAFVPFEVLPMSPETPPVTPSDIEVERQKESA